MTLGSSYPAGAFDSEILLVTVPINVHRCIHVNSSSIKLQQRASAVVWSREQDLLSGLAKGHG
jgi:hypothetical protein